MANNVTSNPSSTKSPSPAPGPGVLPIQSIPAPTDVRTIESITQAMEVTSDFVGHVQSSVRLDVPVLNATGSGFTSVTASSTPALGGTVTPSGSVHIADGTRFVIQIQTGGATGTATFKTSVDGGNTYGALQTTAASMTDATSGITLAFSGTFNSGGTATFRSAFTPVMAWVDSAGNIRGITDHNGYLRRRGQRQFYMDWTELGFGSIIGSASNTVGRLGYSQPASWQTQATTSSVTMPGGGYLSLIANNIANATTARYYTPAIVSPASSLSLVLEFDILLSSTSNFDWKIGLVNSASSATGTPSGSERGFALCKQSADTTYQLLTSNGSSFTKTNTGITPSASADRITIEFYGSGSPYGTRQRMFINDAPVIDAAIATAPNGTGDALSLLLAATSVNATNSANVAISPVTVTWNAYLSSPSV